MRASVAELRAPAAGLPMALAALSMPVTTIDEAQIARARELVRDLHLRRDIPDPTRRHLAEMRLSIEEAAVADPAPKPRRAGAERSACRPGLPVRLGSVTIGTDDYRRRAA
jgi:hypothetical protein